MASTIERSPVGADLKCMLKGEPRNCEGAGEGSAEWEKREATQVDLCHTIKPGQVVLLIAMH